MGDFFSSYLSFFPHPICFLHNKHIKPGLTGELNLISPLASDQNNYVIPPGWCWHFESPHTCGINGTKCRWGSLVTASNWAHWLQSPTQHSSRAYCVLWLAGGAAGYCKWEVLADSGLMWQASSQKRINTHRWKQMENVPRATTNNLAWVIGILSRPVPPWNPWRNPTWKGSSSFLQQRLWEFFISLATRETQEYWSG